MTAVRIPDRVVRRRSITLSACVLTVVALLPGCSFWAENVVAENYAPADGLSADLPDLKVRNLLVVGSGAGTGVLSASLFNLTSDVLTVRITVGDGALDTTVDVPGDGRLTLTGASGTDPAGPGTPATPSVAAAPSAGAEPGLEDGPAVVGGSPSATDVLVIDALPAPPGGAVTIGITSPGGGTVTRSAPVVLDQGPYQGFLPTPTLG